MRSDVRLSDDDDTDSEDEKNDADDDVDAKLHKQVGCCRCSAVFRVLVHFL